MTTAPSAGVSSEAEAAQTGMIVRSPTQRPAKRPILLADRQVVDGRMAFRHQPLRVELPVLVTEGAKPVAGVVMPLVRESNGDAIVPERPQLLDQSIVQLAVPFAPKKRDDLLAPGDEFGPIAPAALETIGTGHPLGVARIPAILGSPHLLDRRVERERRQRRSRLGVYVDQ